MSVSSEQNTSAEITGGTHTNPHAACASCCEVPAEHDHDHDHEHGFEVVEVLRVVFVALAAAAVSFHLWEPFHRVSVIGLAATLIGGYPIFKEAFENVVERRMTMELSMTIALASALAIGEFFTALVITAFVLGAEILEGLTVGRGRRAIQDMLNFLPQAASVVRDGQTLEVATDTILPGEIVLIRPGSRIPVDGQVVSGHSFVEEAAITGEPMPSEKTAGSAVYAGAITRPALFRSSPSVWARRPPSARSLKRWKGRNIRARLSRRLQTALRAISFTSHLALRCSPFSSPTTSGRRSRLSLWLGRVASQRALRLPSSVLSDAPHGRGRLSRAAFILKRWGTWILFFSIRQAR
jgi:E1-E2 ATPase